MDDVNVSVKNIAQSVISRSGIILVLRNITTTSFSFMKRIMIVRIFSLFIKLLLISFVIYTPKALLRGKVQVSDEILNAIALKKPILALESTIITHGLPYPTNVETQEHLEKICRQMNVIPATIAVLNGKPIIGLTKEQIKQLALSKAQKASAYDLQYMMAFKENASTTVAGTIRIASGAGLTVFSTGGIGGVHRFQDKFEFDVSADLTELKKSKVIVVSAGCKAILDLRGTLEVLETNEVLTVGYCTREMPAFYSRKSGIALDYSVNNSEQAAKLYLVNKKGYLLLNPIPEDKEIKQEVINPFIEDALKSIPQNIKGKQVTPYLLEKLSQITGSQSVQANLALIENNVKVGASIAVDIQRQQSMLLKYKNPVLIVCGLLHVHDLKKVLLSLLFILITTKIVIFKMKHEYQEK